MSSSHQYSPGRISLADQRALIEAQSRDVIKTISRPYLEFATIDPVFGDGRSRIQREAVEQVKSLGQRSTLEPAHCTRHGPDSHIIVNHNHTSLLHGFTLIQLGDATVDPGFNVKL